MREEAVGGGGAAADRRAAHAGVSHSLKVPRHHQLGTPQEASACMGALRHECFINSSSALPFSSLLLPAPPPAQRATSTPNPCRSLCWSTATPPLRLEAGLWPPQEEELCVKTIKSRCLLIRRFITTISKSSRSLRMEVGEHWRQGKVPKTRLVHMSRTTAACSCVEPEAWGGVCVSTRVFRCVCMSLYVCVCVFMCVFICVDVCIYMSSHVFKCV